MARRGVSRGLRLLVLLLVTLVAGACTASGPRPSPSPSPSPAVPSPAGTSASSGPRLAVVLPPASARPPGERSELRAAVEELARRHDDDLVGLRVVQPDTPTFVADTTALVAERGADLVCVLGAGSGAVVLEVAPAFPTTRFCATPAAAPAEEVPPNVLLVDVRVEELAFLAGAAARLAAPMAAPGFVAGEPEHAIDRQREAFIAGINAVAEEPVTPYVGFPAGDADRAFELARAQFEAGAVVIYSAAGPGDAGVLRAATATDRFVIGPRATLAGDDGIPAQVLLTVDTDPTVGVEVALRRALASWEGGRATVGLAEGAIEVAAGAADRYRAVAGRIEELRRRIVDGDLRPLPSG